MSIDQKPCIMIKDGKKPESGVVFRHCPNVSLSLN